MRSFRRVTPRVAPALASLASIFLFATCDFDKISGTPTPLTQQDIDRLFSITPTDTTIILGGTTTLAVTPGANIDLAGTTKLWSSSAPTIVAINELSGVASGLAIGNAVITARVLAPELDTGYSKTRALRVRFKAIKACGSVATQCSPSSLDSIAGLNLSRPTNFFGTNNSDQITGAALTGVTLSTRDSAATTNTVVSVTGSNVFARKNGTAYVIGVFENMRDSIRVKVRQVAKSLTFPTTDYTANSLNANRTLPITMRDINDSVMTSSPRLRWASSDTSVVTIDSITGILRVKKVDTARIFVRVDTILNRSQKLRVDQALAGLTKFAGDAASDTVGRVVTIAPTVTAVDSGNVGIAGDTVIFRIGSGAGVVTDSVKITDVNGRATVGSWQLGSAAVAQTLIATSGSRSATFTVTGLPLRASKLGFGVQPRATATGVTIAPAVTVSIRDSLNNLVTTATDSVFIAIGNNPSAATLSGTRRAAAVAGVATFSNLALSAGGSAFTLAATSAGALTGAISDAFDIFGTAAKLGVGRQPVATSAGAILDTIQIQVMDANNTTIATGTNNVTLQILNNAGSPTPGTLTGTTTVAAVNGIATFTGLAINNAGTGYTLQATSTGLTPVTTSAFNINPVGVATKLAITTQPPATFASGTTPQITVAVQDANGATVSTSSASVTIALVSSNGAQFTGTPLTKSAVNGIATFTGISVNKVGTGYQIQATSSGLAETFSNTFAVTPGTASKLAFIDQPTHTVVSTTMSPSVRIGAFDANDNLVTSVTPTAIAVTLTNCTGPTMTGTTSANTASGIASFSALAFGATTGVSCRLSATATGLTTATSDLFSIVPTTGAIRLSFFSQPTSTQAGTNLPSFVVRAVDQNGAIVTTASPFVTLSVLSGPGTIFQGSQTTASSGAATFSVTQLRTAGTYKLLATATGFKVDSSASFTISAGALNKLGFVQQPANITAGVPFSPAVSVAFQDQYGNTITSQTNVITLHRNVGPGASSLSGGPTEVAAVNGVATFPGVTLKLASPAYNLTAGTPSGLVSNTVSNNFSVTAGPPATLGFTTQPTSFQSAGQNFNTTVQAQDSVGNTVSNFTNQVTLALTGGDPTATLFGTTTLAMTSGSAGFTNLSVQKAGTNYRLNASASGLTTGQSNSFTVTAGTATKLGWIDQIANTVQNAGLDNGSGSLPRVAVQDQYGNTLTSSFNTIRVEIQNNPGGSIGMRDNFGPVTNIQYNTGGDGIIELSQMSLTGSGSGVTLRAFTPFEGLTQAISNSFDLAAFGSPAKLAFKQQPTNGTLAVALNPAVELRIEDDFGNTVTTATNEVSVVKSADPNGNTILSGGNQINAVAGVATFGNLYLDKAGNGFTLTANGQGLSGALSSTFNITSPGFMSTVGNMTDMTRIGDRIYWIESVDDGRLKSMLVTGGTITTHAVAATARARRIASDGTNIYWIESGTGTGTGSVRRYNVAANTTTILASGLFDVRTESNTFATDGTNVYFLARSQSTSTAAIKKVTAGGGLQTPTDIHAGGANTGLSFFFTVAGGIVYFYDDLADKLARMTTDGANFAWMTNIVGFTQRLVLASNNTLYFSEGNNIKVLTNAHTAVGLIPTEPVLGIPFVRDMTIEGDNLYVKTGNIVRRYNVTALGSGGSSADLTFSAMQNFESLLLDGTYLYWAHDNGGIGKIPK